MKCRLLDEKEKTMGKILGVCCSCQSTHPVTPISTSARREILQAEDRDEEDYERCYGEAGNHVMLPHRIFGDTGPECDGAGDLPQTIVSQ
jgi:hypothetical protein